MLECMLVVGLTLSVSMIKYPILYLIFITKMKEAENTLGRYVVTIIGGVTLQPCIRVNLSLSQSMQLKVSAKPPFLWYNILVRKEVIL